MDTIPAHLEIQSKSSDWMEPGYFGRTKMSHFEGKRYPRVIGWNTASASSNGQPCVLRMQRNFASAQTLELTEYEIAN